MSTSRTRKSKKTLQEKQATVDSFHTSHRHSQHQLAQSHYTKTGQISQSSGKGTINQSLNMAAANLKTSESYCDSISQTSFLERQINHIMKNIERRAAQNAGPGVSQSLNLNVPGKLLPTAVQRGMTFGQDLTKYVHNQSNVQANNVISVGETYSQAHLSSDVVPNEEAQEQDCQHPTDPIGSHNTASLQQQQQQSSQMREQDDNLVLSSEQIGTAPSVCEPQSNHNDVMTFRGSCQKSQTKAISGAVISGEKPAPELLKNMGVGFQSVPTVSARRSIQNFDGQTSSSMPRTPMSGFQLTQTSGLTSQHQQDGQLANAALPPMQNTDRPVGGNSQIIGHTVVKELQRGNGGSMVMPNSLQAKPQYGSNKHSSVLLGQSGLHDQPIEAEDGSSIRFVPSGVPDEASYTDENSQIYSPVAYNSGFNYLNHKNTVMSQPVSYDAQSARLSQATVNVNLPGKAVEPRADSAEHLAEMSKSCKSRTRSRSKDSSNSSRSKREQRAKAKFEADYGRNVIETVAELADENSSTDYGKTNGLDPYQHTFQAAESARASVVHQQVLTGRRGTCQDMSATAQSRKQVSSRAAETEFMSSQVASEELNEFGAPILIKKALGDYQNHGISPAYSNINDFRRVAYKEDSNGPNYSSMGPTSTYRKRNTEPIAEPVINTERIHHDHTSDSENRLFFSALQSPMIVPTALVSGQITQRSFVEKSHQRHIGSSFEGTPYCTSAVQHSRKQSELPQGPVDQKTGSLVSQEAQEGYTDRVHVQKPILAAGFDYGSAQRHLALESEEGENIVSSGKGLADDPRKQGLIIQQTMYDDDMSEDREAEHLPQREVNIKSHNMSVNAANKTDNIVNEDYTNGGYSNESTRNGELAPGRSASWISHGKPSVLQALHQPNDYDDELQASPSRRMHDEQDAYNSQDNPKKSNYQQMNMEDDDDIDREAQMIIGPPHLRPLILTEVNSYPQPAAELQKDFFYKTSNDRQSMAQVNNTKHMINTFCSLTHSCKIFSQNEEPFCQPQCLVVDSFTVKQSQGKFGQYDSRKYSVQCFFRPGDTLSGQILAAPVQVSTLCSLFRQEIIIKQERLGEFLGEQRLDFSVVCSAFERALASYQGSLSTELGCKFVTIVDATIESYRAQHSSRSAGAMTSSTQQLVNAPATIHDYLYRQAEDQRQRLALKQQMMEQIRLENELEECTFSPQPQRPCTMNSMNGAAKQVDQFNTLNVNNDGLHMGTRLLSNGGSSSGGGLTNRTTLKFQNNMIASYGTTRRSDFCSPNSHRANSKIRHADDFYKDMMNFKTRRDAKLNKQRMQEEKKAKEDRERRHRKPRKSSKSGSRTARVNGAKDREKFFVQLNQEKLRKAKGLSQTAAQRSDDIQDDQRSQAVSAKQSTRQSFGPSREKGFNGYFQRSKSLQCKRKRQEFDAKTYMVEPQPTAEEDRSTNTARTPREICDALYKDYFDRVKKKQSMQQRADRVSKQLAEGGLAKTQVIESQPTLETEVSRASNRSNQILANKIAMQAKAVFDKFVAIKAVELQRVQKMLKLRQRELVIEEKSGECESSEITNKHALSRSQEVLKQVSTSKSDQNQQQVSTQQPVNVDGLDYNLFKKLLIELNYLRAPSVTDDRQSMRQQEESLVKQAWDLISHATEDPLMNDRTGFVSSFDPNGKKETRVVNLRNLIIFLLGIQNIFIDSMACHQKQEDAIVGLNGEKLARQPRQIGFFIGQNFFLNNESDSKRLLVQFQGFINTKLAFERDLRTSRGGSGDLRQSQRPMTIEENKFIPQINKRSSMLAQKKAKGLYTFSFQTQNNSDGDSTGKEVNAVPLTTRSALRLSGSAESSQQYTGSKSADPQKRSQKKSDTRHENFLIETGRKKQQDQQAASLKAAQYLGPDCTFRPNISKSKLNKGNGCQVLMATKPSSGMQTTRGAASRNKVVDTNAVTGASQIHRQYSVFENLYKKAEEKREKSEDGVREARKLELQKLRSLCTFQPNLSKTSQINKTVTSKLYNFKQKEPKTHEQAEAQKIHQMHLGRNNVTKTSLLGNRHLAAKRDSQSTGCKSKGNATTCLTQRGSAANHVSLHQQYASAMVTQRADKKHIDPRLMTQRSITTGHPGCAIPIMGYSSSSAAVNSSGSAAATSRLAMTYRAQVCHNLLMNDDIASNMTGREDSSVAVNTIETRQDVIERPTDQTLSLENLSQATQSQIDKNSFVSKAQNQNKGGELSHFPLF